MEEWGEKKPSLSSLLVFPIATIQTWYFQSSPRGAAAGRSQGRAALERVRLSAICFGKCFLKLG